MSRRRMKICHLLDTLAMGGAEKVAVLHARELSRRGHDVTLLSYYPGNAFTDLLRGEGVTVKIAGPGKMRSLASIRATFQLKDFDVVHAYKMRSAVWSSIANFGLTERVSFIGQHYLDGDPWHVRSLASFRFGKSINWIVPSKAAAAAVESSYGVHPASITLVPNPVDLGAFTRRRAAGQAKLELGISIETPVISIVANLHPWKNYGMFLRVAEEVLRSRPDARFLCVGRDQFNGAIQAECERMGLAKTVRFLGHRDDVPQLLEATDVLVVTSPRESFCLALAEAGAMGIPTVSTDNGGAREIVLDGESGTIVPKGDFAAMANAVVLYLNDSKFTETTGKAARDHIARTFALEPVVDLLERRYTEAI